MRSGQHFHIERIAEVLNGHMCSFTNIRVTWGQMESRIYHSISTRLKVKSSPLSEKGETIQWGVEHVELNEYRLKIKTQAYLSSCDFKTLLWVRGLRGGEDDCHGGAGIGRRKPTGFNYPLRAHNFQSEFRRLWGSSIKLQEREISKWSGWVIWMHRNNTWEKCWSCWT